MRETACAQTKSSLRTVLSSDIVFRFCDDATYQSVDVELVDGGGREDGKIFVKIGRTIYPGESRKNFFLIY